jgi:hypothetical protein
MLAISQQFDQNRPRLMSKGSTEWGSCEDLAGL